MNPLRIAAWAVQLACEVLAPQEPWPDSEQPLIEPPLTGEELAGVRYLLGERLDTALAATADNLAESEPMPLFFGGFDDSSAGSTAPEAGVDPGEGPTPGRDHTPGVGHPNWRLGFWCYNHAALAESCECPVPQKKPAAEEFHKSTKGLLISAAIGLREYVKSDDCEAPTYWSAIADQLDPK